MLAKRGSNPRIWPPGVALLGLLLMAGGCSENDATAPGTGNPSVGDAASLSKMAEAPAAIGETLDQLDLLQNPMTSLAGDAGIYQQTPLAGWMGQGLDYPAKSAETAAAFKSLRGLGHAATTMVAVVSRRLTRLQERPAADAGGKDAGDTISVEYFTGPDSTGLNALIETETPDLVRFVSLRNYPARLGHVVRRDQEILLDTNGTLENPDDDEYHSLFDEQEMFGGEVATGTVNPVSGSGPMLPGVRIRAVYHVQDPRWHPLQEWTEAVMTADLGEFRVEGDESIYSLESTVHWRDDSEHQASVAEPAGGAIEPDTIVEARGHYLAAPVNPWLQEVQDTLRVRLGDLDVAADDLLLEASRAVVFDGTASDGGSPRSSVHFLPDEPVPPGQEPCGGQAEQDVWYPATWWVVHVLRAADIECDRSGSLHVLTQLRDGSSYERWITWDGAGAATVIENRPDGTSLAGSYDEGTGQYSLVTTYAPGHDPVHRDQHGQVREGSLEAWDIVTWGDAHSDTTAFVAAGGETAFTITGYRTTGDLREDFSLIGQQDESLAGTWTRSDGAAGDFTLEALEGGGGHLVFTAANPTAPGEPELAGEIWYAPDGSGNGTATFTQYGVTVTYTITFGPDGSGTLTDGQGDSHPI